MIPARLWSPVMLVEGISPVASSFDLLPRHQELHPARIGGLVIEHSDYRECYSPL